MNAIFGQPLVSVIVPVYNAERGIARCIESILNQSLRDIELILVDDGSSDRSGTICDEYAVKDGRISVVHKANEGVAATRMVGINLAKGEYSIQVDADDWVGIGCRGRMPVQQTIRYTLLQAEGEGYMQKLHSQLSESS